jgi:hypothetical protein
MRPATRANRRTTHRTKTGLFRTHARGAHASENSRAHRPGHFAPHAACAMHARATDRPTTGRAAPKGHSRSEPRGWPRCVRRSKGRVCRPLRRRGAGDRAGPRSAEGGNAPDRGESSEPAPTAPSGIHAGSAIERAARATSRAPAPPPFAVAEPDAARFRAPPASSQPPAAPRPTAPEIESPAALKTFLNRL